MAVTCTRNVQVIVRCGVITVYYLSVLCSGSDKVPPPLRLETISVRNGPCPVSRKPPPESSVPGEKLTRGSRRNQLRRGHGSPPVLSEVLTSLAFRCALQRVQTVPATIHSGRIPPPRPTSHGGGRLISPHHPVRWPYRRRPHLLN